MNINYPAMALSFMGATTDEKRAEIIKPLGKHVFRHVQFCHVLTNLGHPHDYRCYFDLMAKQYPDN
jgi:hypothetical protein